ncbi:MAG TPA: hypothetical protein VFJ18_05410, partial [Pararhizobium sp.]|nr:hypothetical protein [Pararhizobium sp.]
YLLALAVSRLHVSMSIQYVMLFIRRLFWHQSLVSGCPRQSNEALKRPGKPGFLLPGSPAALI